MRYKARTNNKVYMP